MDMKNFSLLAAAALFACAAHAQDDGHERLIRPGGGFALSAQGPIGFETSLHYFMGVPSGKEDDHLYIVGPELTVGTYFNGAGFWGQRMGLRQFYLYKTFIGVSGTTYTVSASCGCTTSGKPKSDGSPLAIERHE